MKKLFGYIFLGLAISTHADNVVANEALMQEKKASLAEFLRVFRQASEQNAFSNPQKLNEFLPMTIEWRPKEHLRSTRQTAIAAALILNPSILSH